MILSARFKRNHLYSKYRFERVVEFVIQTSIQFCRLAPVSNVNFFSKTDNLFKIAIYKLYLEVEVLGLDIRVNLTIREDRIFR